MEEILVLSPINPDAQSGGSGYIKHHTVMCVSGSSGYTQTELNKTTIHHFKPFYHTNMHQALN